MLKHNVLHVRNSYEIHGSFQKVSGSSGKFPGVSGNLPGRSFQLPGTGELFLSLVQRCPGGTPQGTSSVDDGARLGKGAGKLKEGTGGEGTVEEDEAGTDAVGGGPR